MKLIELTRNDEPYIINLDHVAEFFPRPLGGTRFLQSVVTGDSDGLTQASVDVAEDYRDVIAIIRDYGDQLVIPARALIAARDGVRVNAGGEP